MTNTPIHSYTKTVNGKLVTVRSYEQGRGEGEPTGPAIAAPVMPSVIHARAKPQMLAAKQGTYRFIKFPQAAFTRGQAPKGVFPAGRTILTTPVHGWVGFSALSDDFIALANAAEDWSNAVQDGIEHLQLVIGNNPGRSMYEILSRPDVQDALRSVGLQGAQAAIQAVDETWQENGGPVGSPYLDSIKRDLARNGLSFASRMEQALRSADRDQVQTIILKDRLRAAAAQATAETRAREEAALAAMQEAGVTHVRWVARLDKKTCSGCLALHGKVVGIGLEFDHNAGNLRTPVYYNLICPPRHPNCRCHLEAVEES